MQPPDNTSQERLQFSRQKPPYEIITVNYNHLGSHNELVPKEYVPSYNFPKPQWRQTKRVIVERRTQYPDFNKPKETPLFQPYYNYGKYNDKNNLNTDIYTDENDILTGASIKTSVIPIF